MREALRMARKAAKQHEVPIGAVIVHEGKLIARAWNQVETLKDATAHSEMLALTQAQSALGASQLRCDAIRRRLLSERERHAIAWSGSPCIIPRSREQKEAGLSLFTPRHRKRNIDDM